MIKVCLSHDIDRIDKSYQYITKPLRALKSGNFKLFFRHLISPFTHPHPYWGFDTIMEIEKRYGARSTMFFLNESIGPEFSKPKSWKLAFGRYDIHDKRMVNVIKKLEADGWEIGIHGSYNSYKDYELLKREKEVLEGIVGHPIRGIRQHYLNISESTWEIQNKVGLKYDSSWGHTKDIGCKEGKILPFFPIEGSDFCEIPMTIMDGPFSEAEDRWGRFMEIIEETERTGGYLVINYHNNNFDCFDNPGCKEDYIRMLEILHGRGAKFMTLGEAYEMIIAD